MYASHESLRDDYAVSWWKTSMRLGETPAACRGYAQDDRRGLAGVLGLVPGGGVEPLNGGNCQGSTGEGEGKNRQRSARWRRRGVGGEDSIKRFGLAN